MSIRAAGLNTMGVKLLDLKPQDKISAAVVIPPEEAKVQPEEGTLLQ
jgi:DNA gyrase subunit A